ncbi:MAG: protein kinase domain-containing protein [Elainellaceae cyanobacterium]
MSSICCSQGHENSPDSRFCRLCGEQLVPIEPKCDPRVMVGAESATVVGLRYRIRCQLGHGGFGRTYLGEDIHRFDEACVLKEFAPQVEGSEALRKAESLFEREAGVLYRLHHPQIPKFRELLRADFEGRERLFLVQDYIEGQTYQELIEARQRHGQCFTEAEIIEFLQKVLPVLQYIHSAGVIHRDISPDNLILRDADQTPVLIDFGGVKQAAYVAATEFAQHHQTAPPETILTLLGKQGYAPKEQLRSGQVFPHSDLYALAVTSLVLLTGQSPHALVNEETMDYWQHHVQVSPALAYVLKKMLSPKSGDRYQSARDVLQRLNAIPKLDKQPPSAVPYISPSPKPTYHAGQYTAPVPSTVTGAATRATTATPSMSPRRSSFAFGQLFSAIALIVGVAGLGWWIGYQWLSTLLDPNPSQQTEERIDSSPTFSADEQARKQALRQQREQLGVDEAFLVSLTDASFYDEYPDQQGRALTESDEDAEWRSRWDAIAADWLDTLEETLSADARESLGSYTQADREQWRDAVNQLNVSSDALYDLTDARFFHRFPDQVGHEFINQPIGQVWHGIAADELDALQSGKTLTRIRFPEGEFGDRVDGTLQPGGGQVYILGLSEGQILRLNLQAPSQTTLLSIYVPSPTSDVPYLLADSRDLTWSGQLPQTGFYEVVVVSTSSEPVSYELTVSVDNVTTDNVEPPDLR